MPKILVDPEQLQHVARDFDITSSHFDQLSTFLRREKQYLIEDVEWSSQIQVENVLNDAIQRAENISIQLNDFANDLKNIAIRFHQADGSSIQSASAEIGKNIIPIIACALSANVHSGTR